MGRVSSRLRWAVALIVLVGASTAAVADPGTERDWRFVERIKPGMPRGEALERAREIIAEDVAAARAGGAIPAD